MNRKLKEKKPKPLRFNRGEKTTIAIADLNNEDVFKCISHGIYLARKDKELKNCPYCKKESEDITNRIKDLQEEFRREVGIY